MDGRKLVAQKVRLLSIMAGNFGASKFQGKPVPKGSPEFNLIADVASARTLFDNWPTPIVASGVEIGLNLLYPPESIEQDYAYAQDHPIAETYRTFCETQKDGLQAASCPHAQPTFDLTSVLYAGATRSSVLDTTYCVAASIVRAKGSIQSDPSKTSSIWMTSAVRLSCYVASHRGCASKSHENYS